MPSERAFCPPSLRPALNIWRDLHQRLSQLASLQDRLPPSAHDLTLLASTPPDRIESLVKDTVEEEGILDVCLERLGILIALREAPPDPIPQGRSSKKRRLEPEPPTASPTPPSLLDPSSLTTASTSRTSSPAPLSLSRSQIVSSRASTPHSEPANRRDTRGSVGKLSRRTALRDQLPLLPGRLVAFRRPRKPDPSRPTSDEWIMARVVRSISNDKNRYEVEDADEGSSSEPEVQRARWNTTLKSIIPLPELGAEPGPAILPPGTDVLGLYPDTTTFYRGKIRSIPTGTKIHYMVCFEDDGHNGPMAVTKENIVPFSP